MQWKKLSYFKLKDLVKESLLYFSFKLLQLTSIKYLNLYSKSKAVKFQPTNEWIWQTKFWV